MKKRRSQRGATMVEAGLVLLLLLTVLLGIVNFGLIYHVYQVATNAAREGARFSAAPSATNGALPSTDAVRARVQQFLQLGGVTVADGNISVTQATSVTINSVPLTATTVQVQAPYQFIGLPFAAITITTEARMRNETN